MGNWDSFFVSKSAMYIFILLAMDGRSRADELGITRRMYHSKSLAKEWYDSIQGHINLDDPRAHEAIKKLTSMYRNMTDH